MGERNIRAAMMNTARAVCSGLSSQFFITTSRVASVAPRKPPIAGWT